MLIRHPTGSSISPRARPARRGVVEREAGEGADEFDRIDVTSQAVVDEAPPDRCRHCRCLGEGDAERSGRVGVCGVGVRRCVWGARRLRVWGAWRLEVWGARRLGVWGARRLRVWGAWRLEVWGARRLGVWGARRLQVEGWGARRQGVRGARRRGAWSARRHEGWGARRRGRTGARRQESRVGARWRL